MTTDQNIRTYSVPDVSCDHCQSAIDGEVSLLAGVSAVTVDIDTKTVEVTGGEDAAIRAAIEEAGYDIA
ncbi:MAG: cation transporter [Ilumatobacteraceae bacterium]|nr:cation transporter [Ilumatobacteraceae bacterium]